MRGMKPINTLKGMSKKRKDYIGKCVDCRSELYEKGKDVITVICPVCGIKDRYKPWEKKEVIT